MKYCNGKCRRNYIKYEGSLNGCPYHRSFIADKRMSNNKPFEICLQNNLLEKIWRWISLIFFKEFLYANDFRGGRVSKTVQNNRDIGI